MKKLVFTLFLLAGSVLSIQAQNDTDAGIMLINEDSGVSSLSEKLLKKCESLKKEAQWYIKRMEFGKAKDKLNEILTINPADAQAKILLAQCEQNSVQYGESKERKPNKLSFGATIGADFFKKNYGLHLGFVARYGHYTDLVNVTAGLEFELHQSYHGRKGFLEDYSRAVSIGSQLVVPVLVKFNALKCTENTRLYAGIGPELGVKLYAKNANNDMSFIYNGGDRTTALMNSTTVAGLLQVGVTSRHFDVGVYYRHYITDLINDSFSSYQENSRIGFSATYYF